MKEIRRKQLKGEEKQKKNDRRGINDSFNVNIYILT